MKIKGISYDVLKEMILEGCEHLKTQAWNIHSVQDAIDWLFLRWQASPQVRVNDPETAAVWAIYNYAVSLPQSFSNDKWKKLKDVSGYTDDHIETATRHILKEMGWM